MTFSLLAILGLSKNRTKEIKNAIIKENNNKKKDVSKTNGNDKLRGTNARET